jgi:hypothetical protein
VTAVIEFSDERRAVLTYDSFTAFTTQVIGEPPAHALRLSFRRSEPGVYQALSVRCQVRSRRRLPTCYQTSPIDSPGIAREHNTIWPSWAARPNAEQVDFEFQHDAA